MSTITKCDKCDIVIKEKSDSLRLLAWGCNDLKKTFNSREELVFCRECAKGIIKSLNKITKKI